MCSSNHYAVFIFSIYFNLDMWFGSTFFKEFHKGLAQLVKCLLKKVGPSEALLFSPKRGDSLDKFLEEIKENGLRFSVTENYDEEIWRRHQSFMNGDDSWPSYEKDHCYPLLVRIMRWTFGFGFPNSLHIFLAILYLNNRKTFMLLVTIFISCIQLMEHYENIYPEYDKNIYVKIFWVPQKVKLLVFCRNLFILTSWTTFAWFVEKIFMVSLHALFWVYLLVKSRDTEIPMHRPHSCPPRLVDPLPKTAISPKFYVGHRWFIDLRITKLDRRE